MTHRSCGRYEAVRPIVVELRRAHEAVDEEGARAVVLRDARSAGAQAERIDAAFRQRMSIQFTRRDVESFYTWSTKEEGAKWTMYEMLVHYCASGDIEAVIAAYRLGVDASKRKKAELRIETIKGLYLMKKAAVTRKRDAGEKLTPTELTFYLRTVYVADYSAYLKDIVNHLSTSQFFVDRGEAHLNRNAEVFTAAALVNHAYLNPVLRDLFKRPAPTYSPNPSVLDPSNTMKDGPAVGEVCARTDDGEAKTISETVKLLDRTVDLRGGNGLAVYDELAGIEADESNFGRTPVWANVLRDHYKLWDSQGRDMFVVASTKLREFVRSILAAAPPDTKVVLAGVFMIPRDPMTGKRFMKRMYDRVDSEMESTTFFSRRIPHQSRGCLKAVHLNAEHKTDMETLGYHAGTGQSQLDMSVLAFRDVLTAANEYAARLRQSGTNVIRVDIATLYVGVAA